MCKLIPLEKCSLHIQGNWIIDLYSIQGICRECDFALCVLIIISLYALLFISNIISVCVIQVSLIVYCDFTIRNKYFSLVKLSIICLKCSIKFIQLFKIKHLYVPSEIKTMWSLKIMATGKCTQVSKQWSDGLVYDQTQGIILEAKRFKHHFSI